MNYLLSGLYLIFTTLGLVFMKLGGDSLKINFTNGVTFKIGFVTLIGFILYLCSFILWQKILISFNLSYIFPILTGIVQVLSCIIAFVIFKENITIYNILGIILIIFGIVLISIKS